MTDEEKYILKEAYTSSVQDIGRELGNVNIYRWDDIHKKINELKKISDRVKVLFEDVKE